MHFSAIAILVALLYSVSYQALFRLSVYKIPGVYLSGAKNVCVFARYATLVPRLIRVWARYNPKYIRYKIIVMSLVISATERFLHVDSFYVIINNLVVKCDFQQCGILTSVDSDEPVQPPFKLRNYK